MRPLFESREGRLRHFEESGFQSLCRKKAFEISYALFRIAQGVKDSSFARRLEDAGLRLVEDATRASGLPFLIEDLEVINFFLRLGVEAGVVHSANAEVLSSEITVLNSAIAELHDKFAGLKKADIEAIFTKPDVGVENSSLPQYLFDAENGDDAASLQEENRNGDSVGQHSQRDSFSSEKVAIRQSAILSAIRQLPNCSFKVIQDMFPHVSERTLRYDLEHLIGEGVIDRIGSTGPGISYQAREQEESHGYPHVSA